MIERRNGTQDPDGWEKKTPKFSKAAENEESNCWGQGGPIVERGLGA